jgi:hypothetical protein
MLKNKEMNKKGNTEVERCQKRITVINEKRNG